MSVEYELRDADTDEYISLGKSLNGVFQMPPDRIAAFLTDDRIGHKLVLTLEDAPCGSTIMGGTEVESWADAPTASRAKVQPGTRPARDCRW